MTANPDGQWVAQQAKQIAWVLEDYEVNVRFLIHVNDSKFTTPFDIVFQSEGLRVIRTPHQAPNANAFAERWVRSVRSVLNTFIDYYNSARPHQGLAQQSPIPRQLTNNTSPVQRGEVLGGVIGDYFCAPGNTALALG